MWTAKEEEDGHSDDEPGRCENYQLDGTNWCQLEPRHDETSAKTAECARQRPRQRYQSTDQSSISLEEATKRNKTGNEATGSHVPAATPHS